MTVTTPVGSSAMVMPTSFIADPSEGPPFPIASPYKNNISTILFPFCPKKRGRRDRGRRMRTNLLIIQKHIDILNTILQHPPTPLNLTKEQL